MKNKVLFLAFLLLISINLVAQKQYTLQSPNEKITVTINTGDQLSYSVMHENTVVLADSPIGMELDNGTVLGAPAKALSDKKTSVDEIIEANFYKRNEIEDHYNELALTFKGLYKVIFRAYDEGVAYRFQTGIAKPFNVVSEIADFNFDDDYQALIPYVLRRAGQEGDIINQQFYNSFENTPGKMMIGCWAHVRRKFVEALDENKKYASEAIVYIRKLYKIEEEMREAGLDAEAIKERRQKESYPIIQDFEKWMDSMADIFSPKSRMAKALVYTYSLLPRLSRYVLDGRYNIDNNGIENAIRPLALGRKNYLFAGNHDAAVRAAIVYSLFSCCKAADIDTRTWLEDTLRRLPSEKNIERLLPSNWQPLSATTR